MDDPRVDADGIDGTRVADALLRRVAALRPATTACPSEVARVLAPDGADWRALMPVVRDTVRALARQGRLGVYQRGEPVDADGDWRGPIRIGVAPTAADGRRSDAPQVPAPRADRPT